MAVGPGPPRRETAAAWLLPCSPRLRVSTLRLSEGQDQHDRILDLACSP